MSSVDAKIHTLVNKIKSKSAKSIFCKHKVKNTMFSLKPDLGGEHLSLNNSETVETVNLLFCSIK